MISKNHVSERRSIRRLVGCSVVAMGMATLVPLPAHAAPAPEGVHVVKAGENLYRIALTEGVTLDALLAANGMKLDSLILPGQQLKVPKATQGSPAARPSAISVATTKAPPVQAVATNGIYVVQSGDGLFQIAQKLGVKLGDLLAANNLTVTSLIVPGQPLKVPATATSFSATAPSVAGQQATRSGTAPATTTPTITPTTTAPAAPPAANQSNLQQQASAKALSALAFAQSQLGKPYQFAASGPDAYDCSGLIVAAYRSVGVKLPHHSATQATYGVAVDWTTQPILPGDLIFTHSSSGGTLSHVGIAIDAKHYIHSPRTGDVVKVSSMPSATTIQMVRRIVTS